MVRAIFILPALIEAKSPFWRPIKYSLFPPLGLATLADHYRRRGSHDEAYRSFYRWSAILRSSLAHSDRPSHAFRQFCYSAGWKKFEPLWNMAIKLRQLGVTRPLLESILSTSSEQPQVSQRVAEKCVSLKR
jgi:hypothetical protein